MHHAPGHEHELAEAAAAGEAERVVVGAQVGEALAAGGTTAARDHALADHPVARLELLDACAHRFHHAGPLVAGDARIADEVFADQAVQDLEVGAADAGHVAADEHLTRAGTGSGDVVAQLDGAGLLDDDGAHAGQSKEGTGSPSGLVPGRPPSAEH